MDSGIGKRVQIKLVDETPVLNNGNWEPASITILRTWADLKQKNSFRDVQNGQAQFGQFFEFRFRFRGDITVGVNTRLIYDGNKYTLHGLIKEDGKRFYWVATCQSKNKS